MEQRIEATAPIASATNGSRNWSEPLAFAQMIYFLCVQMPFTGGEDGLQGIPRKPLLFGLIPTENPVMVSAFGINVPRLVTLTYGFGVALAALAGVLAAPIQQVSALMGTNLVLVVFAVVVIGGMGSIMGSIVTGFGLGLIEGLTKVFYPPASNTVIFVVMALVLLIKPAGLFGQTK